MDPGLEHMEPWKGIPSGPSIACWRLWDTEIPSPWELQPGRFHLHRNPSRSCFPVGLHWDNVAIPFGKALDCLRNASEQPGPAPGAEWEGAHCLCSGAVGIRDQGIPKPWICASSPIPGHGAADIWVRAAPCVRTWERGNLPCIPAPSQGTTSPAPPRRQVRAIPFLLPLQPLFPSPFPAAPEGAFPSSALVPGRSPAGRRRGGRLHPLHPAAASGCAGFGHEAVKGPAP